MSAFTLLIASIKSSSEIFSPYPNLRRAYSKPLIPPLAYSKLILTLSIVSRSPRSLALPPGNAFSIYI